MEHLRNMNKEHATNFSVLQRFFRANSISLSLCSRVTRYVDYKRALSKRICAEQDVRYLELLSVSLQVNLHYEMYSPLLKNHHFFHAFDEHHLRCMKLIC